MPPAPKVLLVGWDGACWQQIHPLLDAGAMPNLARLVERGVMGDLASPPPHCSPLSWTSIATGQFADRHGILDATEPDPVTGGVRPVTRASLQAPQVWDLLAREGFRCQTIGWPATHPAQGVTACVSDRFSSGVNGSIHPQALEEEIAPLRFQPHEWTGDELQLFVPRMEQIDQDKDNGLARLAKLLAEDVSVHAAATTLLQDREWDFSAIWFGAVGRACEALGANPDPPYDQAIPGVYRFLDLFLGRLVELAGPGAVVILVSDRAAVEPSANRGMLCAAGPGIEPDQLAFGAGLVDIAPTLLALFDFASPADMRGQVIGEVCPVSLSRSVNATLIRRPPETCEPPEVDLRELEALGYTDSVAAARAPEARLAQARRDFHLAQVLLAQGRAAEAVPLLERCVPHATDVRVYLAHAYFQAGRLAECSTLCQTLLAESPDSPLAPLVWAQLAIAGGEYREAREHLDSSRVRGGLGASLDSATGQAYLLLGNWEEAAEAFRSAIAADSSLAAAHEGLARALLSLRLFEEAAGAALDAVRLRYDFPEAHSTLSDALQAMGREDAAAQARAVCQRLRRTPAA